MPMGLLDPYSSPNGTVPIYASGSTGGIYPSTPVGLGSAGSGGSTAPTGTSSVPLKIGPQYVGLNQVMDYASRGYGPGPMQDIWTRNNANMPSTVEIPTQWQIGNTTYYANPTDINSWINKGFSYRADGKLVGPRQADPASLTGGSPTNVLSDLLTEYVKAHNEGLAANEQRYADILGGLRDRYSSAMSGLQGLGQAAQTQINRTYDAAKNSVGQQLASRGLYNSTIAPSMALAVERDRNQAQQTLDEQLRREQLGYQTSLSKDALDFMERRTDQYPSLDQIGNLAMALGRASGGSGATGGGVVTGMGPADANAYMNNYLQQWLAAQQALNRGSLGGSGTVTPPTVPGTTVGGGTGGGTGTVMGGGSGSGSAGSGGVGGVSGGGIGGGVPATGGSIGGYRGGYVVPTWNGSESTWDMNIGAWNSGSDSRTQTVLNEISDTPWEEMPQKLSEIASRDGWAPTVASVIGGGLGYGIGTMGAKLSEWATKGGDALAKGISSLLTPSKPGDDQQASSTDSASGNSAQSGTSSIGGQSAQGGLGATGSSNVKKWLVIGPHGNWVDPDTGKTVSTGLLG